MCFFGSFATQVLKGAQESMRGANWGMAGPEHQVEALHGTWQDLTGHNHVSDLLLPFALPDIDEADLLTPAAYNCVDGDLLLDLLRLDPRQGQDPHTAEAMQKLIQRIAVSFK